MVSLSNVYTLFLRCCKPRADWPVWCLTWASLALIGVSFALLRNLAFRRWLLLSMFSIIRILARLLKICWANLCVTVSFFETGKLCSLRACHSHSADSVEEKSVSESVRVTLSNVWSLSKSVHRAIPVSLLFFFKIVPIMFSWGEILFFFIYSWRYSRILK